AKTRVIFTSTGGVLYGDFNKPPNAEIYPKDPESPYAISKLSIELYLAYCGRILDNRPLTVFGDGLQTRDYIYVGDVANSVWMAATKPLPDKARLDAR